MKKRACICFAAFVALSTGAHSQQASDVTLPSSARASSVARTQISIEEVSAAVASLPRVSGFILFQHGEIVHQHYKRSRTFTDPINIKSASKSILNALLGDRRVSVLILVKLARIFDISIEGLSAMKMSIRPKHRLSPAGMRHANRFQQLSRTQRRFVKRIIDILLERPGSAPK